MTTVWLNGEFLAEEAAKIPATDPGFLHGRGVFETLRAYGGAPFRLPAHLTRLAATAKHLKIAFGKPDLGGAVRELCARNQIEDATIRITLSAGGHLLLTAKPRVAPNPTWYQSGAEVMVAPWRRDPQAPLCGHKTLSYLENVLIHEEARTRNCADALFVGLKGELLEGAVTNVFLVLKDKLITPRLTPGILPGVTRGVILELEKVKERAVRAKELWKADEAFLTNSLLEVVPILKPPGPVTRRVMTAYRDLVSREITGR